MLDLSVPAGQEAEIGPHAYGEQADALPPAFGVVQNGGQLPDADRGLAEGGPARAVPVFRQVEAQDLTAGERLRQKAKGHVCLAGLGPVDGHDLARLCDALNWAKELNCPVVVHVHTVKGKGVSFAERNPDMYHGVGPFDPDTGLLKKRGGETFSSVFGRALADFAGEDRRVCAVTAAMAEGTGLAGFAKSFPDRFFDVGIAEGHGVTMSAGMAAQGLLPVFAVYSTFLQRGYDMLIHDVALEKLHVVLAVDRVGLVGADGETHHGCFDPLFLPALPGYTVLCPASFAELRRMLRRALFELEGPAAVRYPRGGEGAYQGDAEGPLARLRPGEDAVILTYGVLVNQALEAADLLEKKGVRAGVLKLNQIAPLDGETLGDFFENTNIGSGKLA